MRLDLEFEGEGFSEDYNPDNPNDVPLLRVRLYVRGKQMAGHYEGDRDANYNPDYPEQWIDVPKGTYCTGISARVTRELAQRMANEMVLAVHSEFARGRAPLGKIAELLSWVDESSEPKVVLERMRRS